MFNFQCIFWFYNRIMSKLTKGLKETNMLTCLPKQEQLTTKWRRTLKIMLGLSLTEWCEEIVKFWADSPIHTHLIILTQPIKFLINSCAQKNKSCRGMRRPLVSKRRPGHDICSCIKMGNKCEFLNKVHKSIIVKLTCQSIPDLMLRVLRIQRQNYD